MPDYIVRCANRETGEEYEIIIPALSKRSAIDDAVEQGHMVASAEIVGRENTAPTEPTDADMARQALRHMAELHTRLDRWEFFRFPIRTIAFAMVAASLLIGAIGFFLGLAGAFAYSGLQRMVDQGQAEPIPLFFLLIGLVGMICLFVWMLRLLSR